MICDFGADFFQWFLCLYSICWREKDQNSGMSNFWCHICGLRLQRGVPKQVSSLVKHDKSQVTWQILSHLQLISQVLFPTSKLFDPSKTQTNVSSVSTNTTLPPFPIAPAIAWLQKNSCTATNTWKAMQRTHNNPALLVSHQTDEWERSFNLRCWMANKRGPMTKSTCSVRRFVSCGPTINFAPSTHWLSFSRHDGVL